MRKSILAAVIPFLLTSCSAGEAVRRPASVPRIEVVHCRLAPSDEFVSVQFRIRGEGKVELDPAGTYLIDEGTGEKFYIVLLQRLGRLPDIENAEEAATHSLMFRNLDRKLKPGARVTLVVGGMRQEHVVVGK